MKENFYWASGLTEEPNEGQNILVCYKTFEYEEIKYSAAKKDWFMRNVQCWLCKAETPSPDTKAAELVSVVEEAIYYLPYDMQRKLKTALNSYKNK